MVVQERDGSVELRFFRPAATYVSLAGEFNNWRTDVCPMKRTPDGWWHCQLRLAPGFYQFRYHCDGEWFVDYAAFGLDHGPFGLNSVLKVDAPCEVADDRILVAEPLPTPATPKRKSDSALQAA